MWFGYPGREVSEMPFIILEYFAFFVEGEILIIGSMKLQAVSHESSTTSPLSTCFREWIKIICLLKRVWFKLKQHIACHRTSHPRAGSVSDHEIIIIYRVLRIC